MNLLDLEREKFHFKCYLFARQQANANEVSRMNCVSRRDDMDKNLFAQENGRKVQRWNLYSQIAIENGILKCAFENYSLTTLCSNQSPSTQPCTLLDTNEIVNIGLDFG